MRNNNYLWDKNGVRYQLLTTNKGEPYNWLFFPGGPGADSRYYTSLISCLTLPGNIWLIDLPANGDNIFNGSLEYNFDQWFHCFLPVISNFEKTIYVGHSFGGMLPLLFPQLENLLTGFVILNSAPSLWLEEAAMLAIKKGLPLLDGPMTTFAKNPNEDTFAEALLACMPYYFTQESLEKGKAIFNDVPMNYRAVLWWLGKAMEINFRAEWIPQKTTTLILGGSEDCICPASLFEKDTRFQRNNITLKKIHDAGHAPWVEKPHEVKCAFDEFIHKIAVM